MQTTRGLFLVVAVLGLGARVAEAKTVAVPHDHATIQAAIDAAAPGDRINVAAGNHCGAVLSKRVELVGVGRPTIVGCASGPVLFGNLRVGFSLPGENGAGLASGSEIRGFAFDGAGISDGNLAPLAFGVFARFNDNVVIAGNHFTGTVQAITNTGGDGWSIRSNRIVDLTLFGCPGLCGGGDGIVVQLAAGPTAAPGGAENPVNRPDKTFVFGNDVFGQAPSGFEAFNMAGIFINTADASLIVGNRLGIKQPGSSLVGQGILVGNVCCGDPTPRLPGARFTGIFFNDGTHSDRAVVIEGEGGDNTLGLVMAGNSGQIEVEGVAVAPGPGHGSVHVAIGVLLHRRFQ